MFQSTHPRGVRQATTSTTHNWCRFQSTHPRGVRRLAGLVGLVLGDVSIHAPAWGATAGCWNWPDMGSCFNPRTRVGCDTSSKTLRASCCCFNPRTRVGCDPLAVANLAVRAMFQSTHPRGVRPARFATASSELPFQSTHPRGVRRFAHVHPGPEVAVSIHAPAWGATPASGWRS